MFTKGAKAVEMLSEHETNDIFKSQILHLLVGFVLEVLYQYALKNGFNIACSRNGVIPFEDVPEEVWKTSGDKIAKSVFYSLLGIKYFSLQEVIQFLEEMVVSLYKLWGIWWVTEFSSPAPVQEKELNLLTSDDISFKVLETLKTTSDLPTFGNTHDFSIWGITRSHREPGQDCMGADEAEQFRVSLFSHRVKYNLHEIQRLLNSRGRQMTRRTVAWQRNS
uniref:Uncharacterized protein n=1 Tax=Vespula pensylvanica TaxID=30213 RepID=A0A834N8L9_VESPE|nr:hypothetical protein H0235_015969 [Vespula pensylvanica]